MTTSVDRKIINSLGAPVRPDSRREPIQPKRLARWSPSDAAETARQHRLLPRQSPIVAEQNTSRILVELLANKPLHRRCQIHNSLPAGIFGSVLVLVVNRQINVALVVIVDVLTDQSAEFRRPASRFQKGGENHPETAFRPSAWIGTRQDRRYLLRGEMMLPNTDGVGLPVAPFLPIQSCDWVAFNPFFVDREIENSFNDAAVHRSTRFAPSRVSPHPLSNESHTFPVSKLTNRMRADSLGVDAEISQDGLPTSERFWMPMFKVVEIAEDDRFDGQKLFVFGGERLRHRSIAEALRGLFLLPPSVHRFIVRVPPLGDESISLALSSVPDNLIRDRPTPFAVIPPRRAGGMRLVAVGTDRDNLSLAALPFVVGEGCHHSFRITQWIELAENVLPVPQPCLATGKVVVGSFAASSPKSIENVVPK